MTDHPTQTARDVVAELWEHAHQIRTAITQLAARLPALDCLDLSEAATEIDYAAVELAQFHPAVFDADHRDLAITPPQAMPTVEAKEHIAAAIRRALTLIPPEFTAPDLHAVHASLACELAVAHHCLTGRLP